MSDKHDIIGHKSGNPPGADGGGTGPGPAGSVTSPELILEQQILQLKKQHQLQHQILLQHYQAQQQHLAEQHEQQLRQHLKVYC